MWKVSKYGVFFWSVSSRIRTEYGKILRISPYSVQKWKNTDQEKLRIWTLFTQWNWGPETRFWLNITFVLLVDFMSDLIYNSFQQASGDNETLLHLCLLPVDLKVVWKLNLKNLSFHFTRILLMKGSYLCIMGRLTRS